MMLDMVMIREQVIKQLPDFPLSEKSAPGYKQYVFDVGYCHSWRIYKDDSKRFGITLWRFPVYSEFPDHSHDEREWVLVVAGGMTMVYEDGEIVDCGENDMIYNEPKRRHHAMIQPGSEFLVVMKPRANYYP